MRKRENSDAIKIVREFQKKYRETIPQKPQEAYKWNVNPPAVNEGSLTQKNYFQDSQSAL